MSNIIVESYADSKISFLKRDEIILRTKINKTESNLEELSYKLDELKDNLNTVEILLDAMQGIKEELCTDDYVPEPDDEETPREVRY